MTAAYQTISLSVEAGVAQLILNRPSVLNALNHLMVEELRHAAATIAADPAARCLLITGAGRGFCAGADLAQLHDANESSNRGDALAERMSNLWNPMVRDFADLAIPIVSAVNGPAAGGGAAVALLADIVIAARSAYFVLVFGPQLGLVPDLGSTWLMPRAAGLGRAAALSFTGERIGAEAAARAGLVWRVVDDERLAGAALDVARKLAAGPTKALGLIKQALRRSWSNTLDEQVALERDLQREAGQTADFAEGVAAFQQKRQAAFKGN
jgi:2-(1,2-epoxy-1,2-dihydrophenyl)acetyl-CoA isomerase